MKLYKIKSFLILAAGLMLHSCLDLDPQDQLAETNIWSSPADYKLFANQFYSWTRDFIQRSLYIRIITPTCLHAKTTAIVLATEQTLFKSQMVIMARLMHISDVRTCYCKMQVITLIKRILHNT